MYVCIYVCVYISLIIDTGDTVTKNGDVTSENRDTSSEKIPIKRNNEEVAMHSNFDVNSSDDESRDVNDEKWNDAKRRRESSPCNTRDPKSPSNERPDYRRMHGKCNYT